MDQADKKPLISVIIPAKDAAKTIGACLSALQKQDGLELSKDYEVIVVDDGSSDETAELAKKWNVTVISQPNAGPAAARNTGAKAACGDYLVFTDADCVPAQDWLVEITRPFVDHSTPMDECDKVEAQVVGVKGAYLTHEKGWIPRFVQAEYAYKYERMKKLPTIDFIDTYSAAYRKSIFQENGGFDERFPVPSVEDQEFSFRLAGKGYKMVFQPTAVVFHAHDRNLKEYARRKFEIGYWKACMLHWLPEKTWQDSHTSPSQRWQILLLGLAISGAIAANPFGMVGIVIEAVALCLFLITTLQFISFVFEYDWAISLITLAVVLVRAAALGAGLACGFLFPRRLKRHARISLTLGERVAKRAIDLLGGLVGIVLSIPVILAAGLAIKLDSPGPVFFIQERAGENGKPFKIIKLRTMISGAEKLVQSVMVYNKLKGPVYKIPNDPRITRVGRFLRRWSLDELPQFWNVLAGEMSLVGPRPEECWLVARYNDAQRQRLLVRPGLTGPMQVSGRGSMDMDERLQLEIEYICNYSLWKDLKILWHSIGAVLSGKGAS
jgi:lipopolysaccharide/colanic/teichoic acid biosynthesis glycosyltransferase/glycosyltransferase involved in cell wall biosynthesis